MTIRRRAQLVSSAARYRKDLEGRFENETDPIEREVIARELMGLKAQADGPPPPPKKKAPADDDMPGKGKPKGPGADAPPPPPGPPGGPEGDEELDLPPMDDDELGGADGDMDSIMEKLDDVADGIDELTDATKETQEILHELHMDEADEADIDKHVRDQKDEVDKNEDDITDEEFGVKDLKSFYGSNKRSGSTMEDLRARRKARLASARKRKAQSDAKGQYIPDKHDVTLEDDHWAAGDQRDDLRSEAPPVEYTGEDIVNRDDEHSKDLPPVWKSVFAPTGSLKVQLSARCVRPTGSPSYWLVLRTADRKPIAMVRRPKGTSIAAFNTPEFGRKLLAGIAKKGERVLKALKARPITAEGTEAPVSAAPTAPVSNAAPAEPEQVESEVRNHMARFRRALKVAIQASNRNLIAPNVLKASFAAVLEERGMDPQEIIAVTEQAFRMGAAKHFDQIVAKALEWMDKDDSNFAEWEQMVRTSSVVMPPVEDGQRYDRHVEAEGLRRRAMEGSFLPTTAGAGMGDEGSDLASRLSAALPKPQGWYAMRGVQAPNATPAGRRAAAR